MPSDSLFQQKAPGIMALLMADFGLDADGAAAILGNLGHESGGFKFLQEIHPTVAGSAGGWGWAQWTGSRREEFDAYVERNHLDASSDKANYGWLWVELKGEYAKAVQAVKAASGLYNKVVAFELAFEKAGVKAYDSRLSWATKALAAFHAAGDPGPVTLPPAPQIGQILPPLQHFDPNTLAPLLNAALPILLQLLTARVQGATGAQPGQGIDLAGILGQLMGGHAPQPAIPPPVKVEVAAPVNPPKTGLALGLAGVGGSLAAMAGGFLGTPLGMGTDPTLAGNLVPLAFGTFAAIASTGVFGPVGAVIGRVLGAVGPAIAAGKPKT